MHFSAKTTAGERTLAVGPEATSILERRIEFVREHGGDDPRLFVFSPSPLCDDFWAVDSITPFFRRAREHAGLDAPVKPHMIRHWAATKAANAGIPLPELMARFGWGDKRTALRYQHATGGWDVAATAATEEALRGIK